jgi:hypothetical protein
MAKFRLEFHTSGKIEEFDFDGTSAEYIDQRFGTGGLNNSFATLEEITVVTPVVKQPKTIKAITPVEAPVEAPVTNAG